jgi:hypothetical protein
VNLETSMRIGVPCYSMFITNRDLGNHAHFQRRLDNDTAAKVIRGCIHQRN